MEKQETVDLTGSDELKNFYSKRFYFSYSGINKLLFSPRMFYKHYVLNQKEDSVGSHLVKGRVIHCLLLNEDEFNNEFIIIPGKLPSGNNKVIVDDIFKIHLESEDNSLTLENYEASILDLLVKINLHQSLKTDESRLKKVLTEDNNSYFEFLKNSQGKTLVDYETLNYCKECVDTLKQNKDIRSLLQLDITEEEDHLEVHNEQLIQIDSTIFYETQPFGFKGILDNVVIDKEAKQVFINDLKTTGKPLIEFTDSVEYYKYWIQAAIYYNLAFYKYIHGREDKNDWGIQFTFVVVDKYNQVYPFQVTPSTMANWLRDFRDEIIPQLDYHYKEKDYNLPYELALGNVKL